DRLEDARHAGYLIIGEGESDGWTCWYDGLPYLGVPGANNAKVLKREHVAGIERIYLWRETDQAGVAFATAGGTHLAGLGRAGELRVADGPDGAKDPNDLYRRDTDGFKAAMQAALDAAPILDSRFAPIDNRENRANRERSTFVLTPLGALLDEP